MYRVGEARGSKFPWSAWGWVKTLQYNIDVAEAVKLRRSTQGETQHMLTQLRHTQYNAAAAMTPHYTRHSTMNSYANKTHEWMSGTDIAMAAFIIEQAMQRGWAIKRCNDAQTIWAAMASTGQDTLHFRKPDGERIGTLCLIYGNGPGELIADAGGDYNDVQWQEFDDACEQHANCMG